jgi:putative salt-induced outer membrane protein YdiY
VGAAQVSFLNTSGNTETSVLGLGAEAKHKGDSPWSVVMKAAVNRGSVAGKENLSNLMGSLRGARALNDRTDFFVETGYARDTFAGIDSRFGGELGIARKLSITEPHLLTVEAGLGFAHEVRLPAKVGKDFATGRAGLNYKYVISKTADFQEQANAIANFSNGKDWRFTNVASLTAAMNSRFSLKLSHALSRLNTPPVGKKKTDTTIAAALVAKF